ncbi:hypothetical protein QN355_18340 [Cryobacterium sp. 10S3]|uniref:hypothetical protein n=1 Tax=Cryobacterium sp. 10S3 TaxID=3048582 RepID=UPI002AC8C83D|nr:hypothetical protein [Cryobacterium sp. 10S3]MEB0288496.1 hypothetical protein [Cryobacterium sp. 10S3]WPX13140.1 hypothetical protein RHM57_15920 [Cryobacterium sp. 10S3]
MTMEISVSLPLDVDGFLRRECPTCGREFKWFSGRTDEVPDYYVYPDVHWCPLCGQSAPLDQWWTQAQLAYAQGVAAGPMLDELASELGAAFTVEGHSVVPDPLIEPDDMAIIAGPCHPWEPVKVPEEAAAPFYCLVCGEAYAV